ncbi:porin family protein [Hymenobacter yonginensis]|uniref:Outer membrane protein beta-barrel domain-containing protein n=1 Tax=Hymenobacter yonginensis TaxID=748197 RepID=A0ABY7PQU5_9BACT|nr:hypothetical protein [Hymenobacter yonginensis]WBO84818.1 hypothetical protein O9Z63_00925 [Hymenobacter yonginensis]
MKSIYSILALGLSALPLTGQAQHLEAIGVSASFNISQTQAEPTQIQLGKYTFHTNDDNSRLDDTGNRYSVFARFGMGEKRLFVQPEVAYTSVLGNQSSISWLSVPDAPFGNVLYLYPRLRRVEVAALAGLHLGRRLYLVAGPVLARYRRENRGSATEIEALQSAIYGSAVRYQALGQLGLGWQLGRFDLNARYERSLTPYSRAFDFQGQTYAFRQRSGQALLTAGFLLYDKHCPWRR